MFKLDELMEWHALADHFKTLQAKTMQDWFATDPNRFTQFSLHVDEIFLDYSKNRVVAETLFLLSQLAYATGLPEKITALFKGQCVNSTENRPALHTALRDCSAEPLIVQGKEIKSEIRTVKQRLYHFAEQIRARQWLGKTGKPVKYIVNVGIGGSHLGSLMAMTALTEFSDTDLQFFFIADIDCQHVETILKQLVPDQTLVIISSKSFTTVETITNAKLIQTWLYQQLQTHDLRQHMVAVTAAPARAHAFGIHDANVFPLWDWVGGRYSIWSAIGLPLLLAIGSDHFAAFLAGAYQMDKHFREAPLLQNMPVIMALLGIWYINFFNISHHVIAPYAASLTHFRAYLQQADMESNGKAVTHAGHAVRYATGPVIWGETGCNAQHAVNQLLHQGPQFMPIDFILTCQTLPQFAKQHDMVIASCLSQAQALLEGKSVGTAYQEMLAAGYSASAAMHLARHKALPGNRPSSVLFLQKMSPKNLGALIALYEHKIFVQGCIWDINSFDQWGVERGKELLPVILQGLQHEAHVDFSSYDASTQGLLNHYKKHRIVDETFSV